MAKVVIPRALKPPKNYRRTTARVCATCKFLKVITEGTLDEQYGVCERDEKIEYHLTAMDDHTYVCDRWKLEK